MLSHFSAMMLCALGISVVFGITQRAEPRKMMRFGVFVFGLCVVGTIAASWVMDLIKR